MQFAHLVGISEHTFRDNGLFLKSMHEHVLRTHFQVLILCVVKAGSSQRRLSFLITE